MRLGFIRRYHRKPYYATREASRPLRDVFEAAAFAACAILLALFWREALIRHVAVVVLALHGGGSICRLIKKL